MQSTAASSPPIAAEASGAEIVCRVLVEHAATTLFGYAGGAILELYDAVHRDPRVRHVTVRHEQAAAHAAAGWARVTGRPGVCVATSGPGATNLLTGIMDAHMDSTPMIVLTGQVATGLIGRDAFQEADLLSMTGPITKHGFQPRRADDLAATMRAAFRVATEGRPGPVLVDLPKDVLSGRTTRLDAQPDLPAFGAVPPPDPAAVERAAHTLRTAARPLMLLGGGAAIADAGEAALQLAERLAMPVVTTITAKGVVPERHPLAHGMIGMYGRRSGIFALLECDVLLAIGCRFTDRVTGRPETFARGKTLVHVDVDPYELGKNVPTAVAVRADARTGLEALLAATRGAWRGPAGRAWAARMAAARRICRECVPHAAASGVHPKTVMDALNETKHPHDVVTTGVGQHQMFACHFLDFDRPRTFVTSAGAGTMGFGLPAAIGAAAARPGVRVWVVDGDGSFQMTAQELATLAQERLPVTVLVLDNAQLGMVRQWQDRVYAGRHSAARFDGGAGHPDFVRLAGAYGVRAHAIADEAGLRAALAQAASADGPVLLHVPVDAAVDNAPMMPAGTDLASYHGACVASPGVPYDPDERRLIEEARDA